MGNAVLERTAALVSLAFVLAACGSTDSEGERRGGAGTDDPSVAPTGGAGGSVSGPNDAPPPIPPNVDVDACPDAVNDFETQLWNPLLSVKCLGCHNEAGPAGQSRMVLRGDAGQDALHDNYRAVAGVALLDAGERALLLAMPSDTHPEREHPGGELVPESSTDYATLEAFTARVRSGNCEAPDTQLDCTEVTPGPRTLRRLTPVEYDNTIADIFGAVPSAGGNFPADPVIDNFRNQSDALRVTPLLADVLQTSAESIAQAADLSKFAPCVTSALDASCATQLVETLGKKLFRRPLASDELDRYSTAFTDAGGDTAALQLVVSALLQSPHFLYRSELGTLGDDGLYHLDDHEIASELSYLFWASTPDDMLMAEADAGRLQTTAEIEAQAKRLIASPRARPTLGRFINEWLRLDAIETVPKDAATFPDLDAAVRAAMARETDQFVEDVVFEQQGSLADLLTAPTAFVDSTLAAYYGLPDPMSPDGSVAIDASSIARSGLLTSGGLMLVHARSNDASPIHRGRLVRERLLCQVPPPPPPGINAEPPPLDPNQTARERYAAHSSVEPCHSCHRLLDPIGFAFEHFDGAGRYRETDNGNPIDATGEIVSSPSTDTSFDGTEELAAVLAQSTDVRDCFATQMFRHGLGLTESRDTQCLLGSLQAQFRAGDGSVTELWLSLVRTPHFTTRVQGPISDGIPDDEPPPDNPPDDPPDVQDPVVIDAPAPLPDGLELESTQDDDWGAGYCRGYRLNNVGTEPITWEVELPVTGTVNNNWECTVTVTNEIGTFKGLSHNAQIQPGNSATFGFCAMR